LEFLQPASDYRICTGATDGSREFAEVAGLISYGPSLLDLYGRAAGHVGKILKGANPAELPVEQPTLMAQMKTASALQ
jgi:putative ABC transport system substrate-binding protein